MSGGMWFTADQHFTHPKVAAIGGSENIDDHDAAVEFGWKSRIQSATGSGCSATQEPAESG